MTDERLTPAPPRLAQTSTALGELFTDAESSYRSGVDETRAWRRLRLRLDSTNRLATKRMFWAAVAVTAGLLLGWFGWQAARSTPPPLAAGAKAFDPQTATTTYATSLQLASGKSALPDGTEVELQNGAQGTFTSNPRGSVLEFDRGRIDIGVAHQPAGRHFAVKTQGYAFVVLGTRFSVTVVGPRVDLTVSEGRVAVQEAERTTHVIEAGGHWSNAPEPVVVEPPAPSVTRQLPSDVAAKAESPTPHTPVPNDPAACRDLVRAGDPRKAELCYLAISAGTGLSAEMALYEVARLRRDVLSNPLGSLTALDDYETRFTAGTLAPEVRMARFNLLAQLGRVEEALRVSDQLLATASGRARAVELHLLRGNLLRDKKHDCASALLEYRRIESDPGPRGDAAQFARAGCLRQLGRNDEALETYRSYLARPKPQQAERARRQLKELEP